MFRRADGTGFDRGLALLDHAIGNFLDHLLEQHAQVRVRQIIGERGKQLTI